MALVTLQHGQGAAEGLQGFLCIEGGAAYVRELRYAHELLGDRAPDIGHIPGRGGKICVERHGRPPLATGGSASGLSATGAWNRAAAGDASLCASNSSLA